MYFQLKYDQNYTSNDKHTFTMQSCIFVLSHVSYPNSGSLCYFLVFRLFSKDMCVTLTKYAKFSISVRMAFLAHMVL